MGGESGEFIGFEILEDYYFTDKKLIDEKNQQIFCGLFDILRQKHFKDLPDLGAFVDHSGKSSRDMDQHLESSEGLVYFSPKSFSHDTLYRYPDRMSFEPQPLDRLGRQKSRHQVFFGQLEGQWFHERQSDVINVAVKPIPNCVEGRQQVLHEAGMHQYLRRSGLPALDVIGIMLTGGSPHELSDEQRVDEPQEYREPYGYLISRTEDDMDTIDNLKWSGLTIDRAGQRMDYALDTLALLHSHYIFHGDAEFRNIATADSGRSLRLIDLEFARSYHEAKMDVATITEMMNLDFAHVAKSIDEHIGYLFHDSEGKKQALETYRFMLDHVFLPYRERLLRIGIKSNDALAQAYRQMVLLQLDTARDIDNISTRKTKNTTKD